MRSTVGYVFPVQEAYSRNIFFGRLFWCILQIAVVSWTRGATCTSLPFSTRLPFELLSSIILIIYVIISRQLIFTSIPVKNKRLPEKSIDPIVLHKPVSTFAIQVGKSPTDLDLRPHFSHLISLENVKVLSRRRILFKNTYDSFFRPGLKDSQFFHHTFAPAICICRCRNESFLSYILGN